MGEYDFIEDQKFLYGEDHVNSLIDAGYIPVYVAEKGWRWLLQRVRQVA